MNPVTIGVGILLLDCDAAPGLFPFGPRLRLVGRRAHVRVAADLQFQQRAVGSRDELAELLRGALGVGPRGQGVRIVGRAAGRR